MQVKNIKFKYIFKIKKYKLIKMKYKFLKITPRLSKYLYR